MRWAEAKQEYHDKIICHPDAVDIYTTALKAFYAKPLRKQNNGTFDLYPKKEKPVSTVLSHGTISAPHSWVVGNLLFDTQSPQYYKITSVVKTEKKGDIKHTVLTLDTGKKITLGTEASITAFVERYESVTPQAMDYDPTMCYDIPTRSWVQQQLVAAKGPDTIHHYSTTHRRSGDTGITHIGMVAIQELVAAQVVEAMQAEKHRYFVKGVDSVPLPKKRRWFR